MQTNKIAVIGCGPRGLAVLEQLALKLVQEAPAQPLEILIIDAVEAGVGRIWRTDQDRNFLMNTVPGQITMFSGPADQRAWRPGAGPTFHEWLKLRPETGCAELDANGYAPRQVYGQYLKECFQSIVASLARHAEVRIVKGQVQALNRRAGQFDLQLADGTLFSAIRAVVLATGHARHRADADEQAWLDFAAGHGLRYLRGDSAADLPLGEIGAGSAVGIVGMGLGFYDIVSALTVGRGGRFEQVDGKLRYLRGGAEPRIIAGSRSGLPVLARGRNEKPMNHQRPTAFFTAAAIAQARARALIRTGSSALDFERDLRPLLQAEMEHIYYSTELGQRGDGRLAEQFQREHRAARQADQAIAPALLRKYGLQDMAPLDLEQAARPFHQRQFACQADFTAALTQLLERDIGEACRGNLHSPIKAGLDVLRDVRDLIRSNVEYEGLSAPSYQQDFLGRFAPVCALLSAGPPLFRLQELLALLEAGVLEIAGPQAQFTPDPARRRFRIESAQVDAQSWLVQTVVDSKIPTPGVAHNDAPLYRQMHETGLIRAYSRGAAHPRQGGVEVCPATYQVVERNGQAVDGLFAIGIPTESPRWFTQVGSGTPGLLSRFSMDAGTVARGVWDACRAPAAAFGAPSQAEAAELLS